MADKTKIAFDSKTHEYRVIRTDAAGVETTKDKVESIEKMEESRVVEVFQGLAKDVPNKRAAAMTLLNAILEAGAAALAGWKANGDAGKGTPKELKDAFLVQEQAFFRRYLDEKHPMHKAFIGKLPKLDGRGQPLEVNGNENMEARFMYFLTAMRQDSSYAVNKGIVLFLYNIKGIQPVGDDGRLIPPEILRVMQQQLRVTVTKDDSMKGRLYEMRKQVIQEQVNPPDDDMPEILATLRDLYSWAETAEKLAAIRRTQRPTAGTSVNTQAKDAIAQASAQKTLDETKKKPEKAQVVTTES